MTRFKLNWDLVSKDLDAETSELIESVRTNVDSVVDDTVTALESEIRKRIDDFKEGGFGEDFSRAAEEVAQQIRSEYSGLEEVNTALSKATADLVTIMESAKLDELKAAAEAVVAASIETTSKINTQVKNVENFGNRAGRFLTGKALSFLTAGLLG